MCGSRWQQNKRTNMAALRVVLDFTKPRQAQRRATMAEGPRGGCVRCWLMRGWQHQKDGLDHRGSGGQVLAALVGSAVLVSSGPSFGLETGLALQKAVSKFPLKPGRRLSPPSRWLQPIAPYRSGPQ